MAHWNLSPQEVQLSFVLAGPKREGLVTLGFVGTENNDNESCLNKDAVANKPKISTNALRPRDKRYCLEYFVDLKPRSFSPHTYGDTACLNIFMVLSNIDAPPNSIAGIGTLANDSETLGGWDSHYVTTTLPPQAKLSRLTVT